MHRSSGRTAKIVDAAVNSAKLANLSVTGDKLASAAVSTDKLADATVTPQKVNTSGAISGQVLTFNGSAVAWGNPSSGPPSGPAGGDLTGNFPNPTLRAGAVNSGKLADASVTGAKLALPILISISPSTSIFIPFRIENGSTNGTGLSGVSTGIGGIGVEGVCGSPGAGGGGPGCDATGIGVLGNSVGDGVLGISHTVSKSGIHGNNTVGGMAGFFEGPVQVTGTLTKPGGSFKIDHPLEPANKYLSHSFVESPDMKNVYDGMAALDARGEAVVVLPDWFEALNRDFRYQLTAIGAPAPDLYIAEEIANNRFKIAGGRSGMKVSWQVTGTRHDSWAEAHRIQVEEDKSTEDRGYYLHPVEHGQPYEKYIEWARHPEMMRKLQASTERQRPSTDKRQTP